MIALDYLYEVRKITDFYEKDMSAINVAAKAVADAIRNKNLIYFYKVGHDNESDFLNRAGGLASAKRFSYTFNWEADVPECRTEGLGKDKPNMGYEGMLLALKASNIRKGDIMFVGSVSGKTNQYVDLALACKELGITTIGFTSKEYTSHVEATHPSGKKLIDVVDIVIDNGAPFGDACVDCQGLDHKVLPISGVSMIIAGWLIMGTAAEILGKEGNPPTMFESVNKPNGVEIYNNYVKQFNERGY